MKILGNIIWLIFGGLETAIEYFVASIAMFITIIGIPFGLQSIKLGVFCLWPFGSKIKTKQGQPSCLSTVMNVNARNIRGMDYKLSKCCNPVFGDDVFGFVTRTDGIKIHRMSCPNAARLLERYPYRVQKVVWQETASSGDFQVTLSIIAERDQAVLASIMEIIGSFKASLRSFNVAENGRDGTNEITVRILVPSNLELDKVVSQISALKRVMKVRRV